MKVIWRNYLQLTMCNSYDIQVSSPYLGFLFLIYKYGKNTVSLVSYEDLITYYVTNICVYTCIYICTYVCVYTHTQTHSFAMAFQTHR